MSYELSMKKYLKKNFISNIFLLISIILIVLSFFYKDFNPYQYLIIFVAISLYLATSILHHYYDKSLTFEIILEYILIGALAFLIIFGIAL